MKNIDSYQEYTRSTIEYSMEDEGDVLSSGLVGKVGDLYSAMSYYHRGDIDLVGYSQSEKEHLGGILWYICRLADYKGIRMSDLIQSNMGYTENKYVENRNET